MQLRLGCALLMLTGCGLSSMVPTGADGPPDAGPDAGPPPDAAPVFADRRICDGSDGLRFAYRRFIGFALPAPYRIFSELGGPFLYIDGHCHYWVSDAHAISADQDIRTGVLDAASEERIAQATHFASWPALENAFTCTEQPPLDGGGTFFSDGSFRPMCPYCVSEAVSELVEMCGGATDALQAQLFAQGQPLDGPVRLFMSTQSVASEPGRVDWPLASDPAAIAAATTQVTLRIDDLADARVLRALRASHHAAFPIFESIPVRDGAGQLYQLFLREVLPFENDEGLVIF